MSSYKKYGIGILLLLTMSSLMFPLIWNNQIEIAFSTTSATSSKLCSSDSTLIESLVIQGAAYYLESNTVFQDLLNKIENRDVLGTDYESWLTSTEKTKELVDHAIELYCQLIEKAEITPYNDLVLEALTQFDYDNYLLKYNLNIVVFSKVKELLLQGDAIGILKVNYNNLIEISKMLSYLQVKLYNENLTDSSDLLGINEKYSEASLFGSYVARVFQEIN